MGVPGDGEVGAAVGKLRPKTCLIRSVHSYRQVRVAVSLPGAVIARDAA